MASDLCHWLLTQMLMTLNSKTRPPASCTIRIHRWSLPFTLVLTRKGMPWKVKAAMMTKASNSRILSRESSAVAWPASTTNIDWWIELRACSAWSKRSRGRGATLASHRIRPRTTPDATQTPRTTDLCFLSQICSVRRRSKLPHQKGAAQMIQQGASVTVRMLIIR